MPKTEIDWTMVIEFVRSRIRKADKLCGAQIGAEGSVLENWAYYIVFENYPPRFEVWCSRGPCSDGRRVEEYGNCGEITIINPPSGEIEKIAELMAKIAEKLDLRVWREDLIFHGKKRNNGRPVYCFKPHYTDGSFDKWKNC